jgi:hypothetical protein
MLVSLLNYDHLLLRLSIAYGFGSGIFILITFYLAYLGVSLTFNSLILTTLAFLILAAVWVWRNPGSYRISLSRSSFNLGPWETFCILLVALSLTLIISRALILPMHLSDDRAQWGVTAKILFHNQSLYAEELFDPLRLTFHVSYPFFVPLLQCSFYHMLGTMDDALVKFPFPFFFAALLAFFYGILRRFTSFRQALTFTSILATLPSFVGDVSGNPSSGYAEAPFVFFYTVSVVCLFLWMKEGCLQDLLLASLAISFTLFTKREGAVLWAILIGTVALYLLFSVRKSKIKKLASFSLFVLIPMVLLLPWFSYHRLFPIPPWESDLDLFYFLSGPSAIHFERLGPLLGSFAEVFFLPRDWSVLWIVLALTIFLFRRRVFSFPSTFLLVILLVDLSAVLAAVVTFPHEWWQVFLADKHRYFMAYAPLALFIVCFAFCSNGSTRSSPR